MKAAITAVRKEGRSGEVQEIRSFHGIPNNCRDVKLKNNYVHGIENKFGREPVISVVLKNT
jgi:hypothetical protein